MPRKKPINIILPNGEKHTITKQKYEELDAQAIDIFITDNRKVTPESLYQEELERNQENRLSLSQISTPDGSPVSVSTPDTKLNRAERRFEKFGRSDPNAVKKSLNFSESDAMTVSRGRDDRPTSNEEMCRRIVDMLPSIGLTGEISPNFEYVNFDTDQQGQPLDVIRTIGGHFHIIESYGGINPPHTGIRLCFIVKNNEYSIEVDHSSNPKFSKTTSLKDRDNGCNRAGSYIRDYKGQSIAKPAQYLANELIRDLNLNYDKNFQQAKYLFEKLQELYSIIVSANKGKRYNKDAGLITGGNRKTRKYHKHGKNKRSRNKRKKGTKKSKRKLTKKRRK